MTDKQGQGLYELFSRAADRYPDKMALTMVLQEEPAESQIDYKGLGQLVRSASGFLARRGVRQGDKVAIVSSYQLGTLVSILATLKIGAVVTVINADLPEGEVMNFLRDAKARLVIADSLWPEILEDRGYQAVNTELMGSGSFFKNFSFSREELEDVVPVNLKEDLAVYMFTSGTTAQAKAVLLTQANLIASCSGIVKALEIGPGDVVLDITRPFHITGLAAALAPLITGAGHIYTNDYRKIREGLMRRAGVTVFLAIPKAWKALQERISQEASTKLIGRLLLRGAQRPTQGRWWSRARQSFCRLILRMQIQRRLTGPQFRFGVSGGAPLDPKVKLALAAMGLKVIEAWGMTETAAPHLVMDLGHIEARPASVGRPLAGLEAKIIPLPKALQDEKRPELGQLLVKGPNICQGYNDPAITKLAFTRDGWFKTGDIAWQDEEGFFYIVGRMKDVIVLSTGENVYPEELYTNVGEIPWIEEIVFFEGQRGGVAVVAAAVSPDFEEIEKLILKKPYTEEEIRQLALEAINQALQGVAPYKRLKSREDILIVHGSLEKTATQEVKTHVYKRLFAAQRR